MPGNLTGKAEEVWKKVYDERLAAGDDKETAAKKAYGAIKNAGLLEMPVTPDDSVDIADQAITPPEPVSIIDILQKLKKFLEKMGYTIDDPSPTIIENLKIKRAQMESGKESVTELDAFPGTPYAQKILVFPRGYHYVQGYDRWFDFNDSFFNQVIESFECPALSKPFIDKNHEYEMSFGDVVGYEVGEEGMFFRIILNERGVEAVKNREFKSISPAFGEVTDTKGVKHSVALIAISLTNNPALMGTLPTLQEQIALERKIHERGKTMEGIYKLTSILGLQDAASPDAMVKAVEEIKAKLEEAMALIEALTGEKAAAVEEAAAMKVKLDEIETREMEAEAVRVIGEAIKAGKVHPAVREFKIKSYLANKAETLKELELIPATSGVQMTTGSNEVVNLSAIDLKILEERGIDTSDPKKIEMFRKYMGGE